MYVPVASRRRSIELPPGLSEVDGKQVSNGGLAGQCFGVMPGQDDDLMLNIVNDQSEAADQETSCKQNAGVDCTHAIGSCKQPPAEWAPPPIKVQVSCSNLPEKAKWQLEALLLQWYESCVRIHPWQYYATPATPGGAVMCLTTRLWSGSYSLSHEYDSTTGACLPQQHAAQLLAWDDRMRSHTWSEPSNAAATTANGSETSDMAEPEAQCDPDCGASTSVAAASPTAAPGKAGMRKRALMAEAVQFNIEYERENRTPLYDRLLAVPLTRGSQLAPTAVLTAVPPSLEVLQQAQQAGVALAGLSVAQEDGIVQQRPAKRQRRSDYARAVFRCFNCGSYAHDVSSCPKPRDRAAVEANRSHFNDLKLQQQAEREQRRDCLKEAQLRYFDAQPARPATPQEGADPDEGWHLQGPLPQPASHWGRDARPGVLSPQLAAALDLPSVLHPPPWLGRMAVHGLPPGYLTQAGGTNSAADAAAAGGNDPGATCTNDAGDAPTIGAAPLVEPGAESAAEGTATVAGDAAAKQDAAMGNAAVAPATQEAAAGGSDHTPEEEYKGPTPLLSGAPHAARYPGLNANLASDAPLDEWARVLWAARHAMAAVSKGRMRRQGQHSAGGGGGGDGCHAAVLYGPSSSMTQQQQQQQYLHQQQQFAALPGAATLPTACSSDADMGFTSPAMQQQLNDLVAVLQQQGSGVLPGAGTGQYQDQQQGMQQADSVQAVGDNSGCAPNSALQAQQQDCDAMASAGTGHTQQMQEQMQQQLQMQQQQMMMMQQMQQQQALGGNMMLGGMGSPAAMGLMAAMMGMGSPMQQMQMQMQGMASMMGWFMQ